MVREEVVEDSSSTTGVVLYRKETRKTLVEVGKQMFDDFDNDNNHNNSKGKNTRKKNQQKDWIFMRTIIQQSQKGREQLLGSGSSNERQKTLRVVRQLPQQPPLSPLPLWRLQLHQPQRE